MKDESFQRLSVVIPARNEAVGLRALLPQLRELLPGAEIIVSDDGSSDETPQVVEQAGAHLVRRPYSAGNGAAIKAGARAATRDIVLFMDGDGQHRPEEIPALLAKLDEGYDMVVGARDAGGQASRHRGWANAFYNRLASWMVGHPVDDLTSGFRVARRARFLEFLYLLPNGFSYPTTSTMAFFRAGYSVAYVPIDVRQRLAGTVSHIRLWRDGLRFLLIIFKIGTLYSPLKLFTPAALLHVLVAFGYYAYTFETQHRLSSITVYLLSAAVTIFMIGLVSEQITALMYRPGDRRE
jgi:glycosyltransferase involved in cell wall biosynthesis